MNETHRMQIDTPHIRADEVRFIRMGEGGSWADEALAKGWLVYGDADIDETITCAGDWEAVRRYWLDRGRSLAKASDHTREIRDFHTLGRDCLWITFHKSRLWWAFAEPNVIYRPGQAAARLRHTVAPWSCTDVNGEELRTAGLSSFLTQTFGYPQTICGVKAKSYLLTKINGGARADIEEAEKAERALAEVVQKLIERLDWHDFEVLADRLVESLGWRRQTLVGGSQKTVDFIASLPALDMRAYVQVKSSAGRREIAKFVADIDARPDADRMIFIVHTLRGAIDFPDSPNLEIWSGLDLALRVVRAGLQTLVMERSI